MALADSDQKATDLKGCNKQLPAKEGWFHAENGWRNREVNPPGGYYASCGETSAYDTGEIRWLCDRCAKAQGVVW